MMNRRSFFLLIFMMNLGVMWCGFASQSTTEGDSSQLTAIGANLPAFITVFADCAESNCFMHTEMFHRTVRMTNSEFKSVLRLYSSKEQCTEQEEQLHSDIMRALREFQSTNPERLGRAKEEIQYLEQGVLPHIAAMFKVAQENKVYNRMGKLLSIINFKVWVLDYKRSIDEQLSSNILPRDNDKAAEAEEDSWIIVCGSENLGNVESPQEAITNSNVDSAVIKNILAALGLGALLGGAFLLIQFLVVKQMVSIAKSV